MAEYMKTRRQNLRIRAIESLGGKCVDCGSTNNLEFDHINPSTKRITIADSIASDDVESVMTEVQKCQLLCMTCHKKKHSARFKHGTLSAYRHCKCPECVRAHTEYMRQYRTR